MWYHNLVDSETQDKPTAKFFRVMHNYIFFFQLKLQSKHQLQQPLQYRKFSLLFDYFNVHRFYKLVTYEFTLVRPFVRPFVRLSQGYLCDGDSLGFEILHIGSLS